MKNIFIVLILFIFSCKSEDSETTNNERNDNGIILDIPLTGSLQNPAFSPNGDSIIFTRFINGYNQEPSEIYKFNIITEELNLLISDGNGNVNLPGSSWNNNKIIFSSTREPHDEIYLIAENGNSGDEIQITNRLDKVAYEPTLSPDGIWTVFESHVLDVETDGIITKYKIDGSSEYINLTNQGDDCRQPNWSPNDAKILYQKKESGLWNIWTMNTDGTEKTQVTSGTGNNTDASFSSNGQFVVYSSDFEAQIANIYKVLIPDGSPIRLSNYSGYDGAPSISSNGNQLIFESYNGDPDNSPGTKLVLINL